MTLIIHFLLSFLLFFIVNWIGKHSISVGYIQLSMFLRNDEAPAFNLLFRILTPIVYIILLSYVFYLSKFDELVTNIYSIVIIYFLLRFCINVLFGRSKLVNWTKQFVMSVISIILSYWIYQTIVITKTNLMPDFSTISNELWLIVLIFIYQIFNKLSTPTEVTKQRKNNYLIHRYKLYLKKYGSIISTKVDDKKIEALAYAILLYEAFIIPKIVRVIENFFFKFNKASSLGIMQVMSTTMIDDEKSVELGIEKIISDYNKAIISSKENGFSDEYILRETISNYNTGEQYLNEICELFDIITSNFYKEIHKNIKLCYY